MPRLSRSPLTIVAIATLVGSVLLGGGAAWAAWSISGTGAGAVAADTLVVPVVTATSTSTSAITITWNAPGQLPGVTYSVRRAVSGSGTTTGVTCSTSPCTDSGLAPGTSYDYTVTAGLGQWSKSGTASATTDQATPPGMDPVPLPETAFGNNGWKNSSSACDPTGGNPGSSRLCITPVSHGAPINTANGLVSYRLERLTGSNGATAACYAASATSGSAGSWNTAASCSTENPMTYNSATGQFRSLQIPQTDIVLTGTRYYRWTVTGLRDTNGVVAPPQSFTFNAG